MNSEMQKFASSPQAVQTRQKYRDSQEGDGLRNIMHDRRVVRGNTYASLVMPQQDMAEVQKQREAQRRRIMRANQTRQRVGTPEPVFGRKHIDIQTDSYLEELTERTVEFEAETQTDFLLDRPPSPLFMPAKVGHDIATQVLDGELFDFDREVEPVLEVLTGKTLEQSMMEVLEEEELESILRHQEEFEQRRNAELLEVQRMESAERRRTDEMDRRMQQTRAQKEQDQQVMQKVLSRSMARRYLGGFKERALQTLLDMGCFQNSVQMAVEANFVPWLMESVQQELDCTRRNQKVLEDAISCCVETRVTNHANAMKKEQERIVALEQAELRMRAEKEEAARLAILEEERIKREAEQLKAWEEAAAAATAGDPNAVVIKSYAEGVLELSDGTEEITVPEDQQEALTEALANLQEGQMVVGTLNRDEKILTEFKVADPGAEDPGAEADAAAEA